MNYSQIELKRAIGWLAGIKKRNNKRNSRRSLKQLIIEESRIRQNSESLVRIKNEGTLKISEPNSGGLPFQYKEWR